MRRSRIMGQNAHSVESAFKSPIFGMLKSMSSSEFRLAEIPEVMGYEARIDACLGHFLVEHP